ncbi:hypothetical protein [Streptomyces sp. NPDC088707]|uniref:hypothetical protein n=1 Tax=Streptomyces sp. NPDC088707 TaxID=3365871 RepID=UPI00380ED8ED
MEATPVADRINGLPFETWLCAEELARCFDLPVDQAVKVVRAGRRQGSITVDRKGEVPLFMRVHRHRLPCSRS